MQEGSSFEKDLRPDTVLCRIRNGADDYFSDTFLYHFSGCGYDADRISSCMPVKKSGRK